MAVTRFFQVSGDVLQYALPTITGLADVVPDLKEGKYKSALRKAVLISILILIQNRGAMAIKRFTKKPRPRFPQDLESFPSGHMMIAVQSWVRAAYRDGPNSYSSVFVAIGALCIALGRYLPGKHDVVDLTAGAMLGAGLGYVWNQTI